MSVSLERFLLASGERVVRVPPKLMAGARRSARQRGKSDAIDALAVARAALPEPELPSARLEGSERELRLLLDHREDLVAGHTRIQQRLRWHLHELERELARLVRAHAAPLLALPGCDVLTATKLVGETAAVERFPGEAQLAMHAGAVPLPASSGGRQRHRLNRSGNRQLNCALHRLAVTQGRSHPAQSYLARKEREGQSRKEALRFLKRHLVRVVYRTLRAFEEEKMMSTNRPVLVPALA